MARCILIAVVLAAGLLATAEEVIAKTTASSTPTATKPKTARGHKKTSTKGASATQEDLSKSAPKSKQTVQKKEAPTKGPNDVAEVHDIPKPSEDRPTRSEPTVVDPTSTPAVADDSSREYTQTISRQRALCAHIEAILYPLFVAKAEQQPEVRVQQLLAHDVAETFEHGIAEARHDQWSCTQAQAFATHASVQRLVKELQKWHAGSLTTPAASCAETIRLVDGLRTAMAKENIISEELAEDMKRISHSLGELSSWHERVTSTRNALLQQTKAGSSACTEAWGEFRDTLFEPHGAHLPQWWHLSEGVGLLRQQCRADPQLSDEPAAAISGHDEL